MNYTFESTETQHLPGLFFTNDSYSSWPQLCEDHQSLKNWVYLYSGTFLKVSQNKLELRVKVAGYIPLFVDWSVFVGLLRENKLVPCDEESTEWATSLLNAKSPETLA